LQLQRAQQRRQRQQPHQRAHHAGQRGHQAGAVQPLVDAGAGAGFFGRGAGDACADPRCQQDRQRTQQLGHKGAECGGGAVEQAAEGFHGGSG
jgi:hypothetical protein